jgi:hypothetical protein
MLLSYAANPQQDQRLTLRLAAAIDAGGGAQESPAKHRTIFCTIADCGG